MTSVDSVMIVAGEASADLHGGKLVAALRAQRPHLQLFGVGGEGMRAQGFEAIVPAEAVSLAGLTEVLFAIPRILGIMRRLTQLAAERRPKVAILIDLPDFNLRLAKRLKKLGIPVVYYISPQVWAWRQGRVDKIRELVDHMLVILPFEEAFYRAHQIPATFVGHPLLEALPERPDRALARQQLAMPPTGHPVLALLPGSRRKEITRHLLPMLEGVRELGNDFPHLVTLIPVASTVPKKLVEDIVAQTGVTARILDGQATEALCAADAAVVCSGTATLQTALLERPMVVVYRVSWLTYQILKRMIKVANIALVNLIAGRSLVKELVQQALTPQAIANEVRRLLTDESLRHHLQTEFRALRHTLDGGHTAARVADVVVGYVPISHTKKDEACEA